jgi:hypothetical protein
LSGAGSGIITNTTAGAVTMIGTHSSTLIFFTQKCQKKATTSLVNENNNLNKEEATRRSDACKMSLVQKKVQLRIASSEAPIKILLPLVLLLALGGHAHRRYPTFQASLNHHHHVVTTRRPTPAFASVLNHADIWLLRAASAVASYFGFIGYLDRPQGSLIENVDQYVEVKQSTVDGAGLGLFAKASLPKNTVLGTYPGVVIPLQQNLNKLKEFPQCEGYIWRFSDNKFIIDPTNSEGILERTCRGGNPSMPLSVPFHKVLNLQVPTYLCRINEPALGRDVNVVTDEDLETRRVVFSLERDVYAGEEFFIDYGLSYDRSFYGGGDKGGAGKNSLVVHWARGLY